MLLFAAVGEAKKKKLPTDPEELFNPLLGIEYSHWLVGPIARMATEEEIERYLQLASDEEAAAFIEEFWKKRNEGTPVFTDTPQEIFERRVAEADKLFTEGTFPGSHSDRGTIYVLYGEPEKRYYDRPRRVDEPVTEVWEYPKDAEPGLDGEKPKRRYRFVKLGERTVLYTEQMKNDPRLRDLRRRLPRGGN